MYKITHNQIVIPISDFLITLVRPSRHYHTSSYRLITATTDYYIFHSFQELYSRGTNSSSKLWPAPHWSSSTKQSARLMRSLHRKSPHFYF